MGTMNGFCKQIYDVCLGQNYGYGFGAMTTKDLDEGLQTLLAETDHKSEFMYKCSKFLTDIEYPIRKK